MSRANPISLRITSKTFNSSFIGVSKYYFYNQLKEHISISKTTQQLSKQIVFPSYQLGKSKAIKHLLVLNPGRLPINAGFIAKQLFSTQYTLNRRRFFSTTIYYTRWLRLKFDNNYNFITINQKSREASQLFLKKENKSSLEVKNHSLTSKMYHPNYIKVIKSTNPLHYKMVKDVDKISYFHSTKYLSTNKKLPQTRYSGIIAEKHFENSHCIDLRDKYQQINILYKYLTCFKFEKSTLFFVKQSKLTKCFNESLTRFNLNNLKKTPINRSKTVSKTILKTITKQFCSKPDYKTFGYNLFFLMCLSRLAQQNIKSPSGLQRNSITNQLNDRRKPIFLNRSSKTSTLISTSFLSSFPQQNVGTPTTTSTKKEVSSIINQIPGYAQHKNSFYILCSYSDLKKKRLNYDKIQKHIYDFRETAKVLMELRLVIHRSFCQPTGINYISGLENRLSKSNFNTNFTSALFTRVTNDYPKPNFVNSQIGLARYKIPVFFEFLYNQKIKNKGEDFSLKTTNKYNKTVLSAGHQALWLRKGSSIRL